MKRLSYLLAAFAAMTALVACQVEKIEPETPVASVQGFTLTAGYGDPSSKVAFDAEGLDMKWIPDDILYMIDPNGSNRPIKLTTDITEPAKVAKFHTDEVVATGSYIVVNTQNTLYAQLEAYPTLKDSPSGLEGLIRVYGSVSVEKGQTSAEITLHQLYTMLSFNFKNIPEGLRSGLTLGMAVTTDGLPSLNQGRIGADGLDTDYSGTFVYMLGKINAENGYTLIAPVDLSNNNIIFFATGSDADSNRHVYEIFKDGTQLLPGKCYSISFDFSAQRTKYVKLEYASGGMILKSADDFFAAALCQWTNTVQLQADVDFSGKCFLPLNASNIQGNGHTLSYIQCNLEKCNHVGVLDHGNAHNLNVKYSYFTGYNRVGAITGSGACESCSCTDVHITGQNYVGGLTGYPNSDVENCSLLGVCSIMGNNNVGGIVGYTTYDVKNCVAKPGIGPHSVSGHAYVGGIAGAAGSALECGFEGYVTGSDNNIGGVTGSGACTRCYCAGDVSGHDHVGGVSGCSGCTDCYHIGDVLGGEYSSTDFYVAGISGTDAEYPAVSGCYSFGTVNTNCGICMNTPAAELASTNLTSTANLYKETDRSLIEHCAIGTDGRKFVDYLDGVLNVNDAYYDLVWPDIAAGCPILKWQYEGFGVDLTIPGFDIVTL